MDRFEAMQVFSKVVELGSFAAAAERLDMSTSAVSRHVAQLEALLDARLLNRTTRRLSLTENGRAYYERCVQLLADLEETEELVSNSNASPRGTLHVTAPISFGTSHLAPAISAYLALHPQMRFDVSLSDRQVDMVEEGLDLAIRVGRIGNQNLVARPIGRARILIAASPAYLAKHGTPQTPRDFSRHQCLTYAYTAEQNVWIFGDAPELHIPVSGPVHGNNGNMLGELAAQGCGITAAPDFILQPLIDAGSLVEVRLPDIPPRLLTIYAAYPTRKHLSARVRSFVSFLEQRLGTEDLGHA